MNKGTKHIVVLTGAGISADSGIGVFRGKNGLWENYPIEEVATPQGWRKDPKRVLEFYNMRRKQVLEAQPNAAHLALSRLEEKFSVSIITQNIDDLHERAGSSTILHLHGKITQAQSTLNPDVIVDIDGPNLVIGDKCPLGSQLRPNVVWFGEPVPNMTKAVAIASEADVLLIIGTSLNVYPAAGLIDYIPDDTPIVLLDPEEVKTPPGLTISKIAETAANGIDRAIAIIEKMFVELQ